MSESSEKTAESREVWVWVRRGGAEVERGWCAADDELVTEGLRIVRSFDALVGNEERRRRPLKRKNKRTHLVRPSGQASSLDELRVPTERIPNEQQRQLRVLSAQPLFEEVVEGSLVRDLWANARGGMRTVVSEARTSVMRD